MKKRSTKPLPFRVLRSVFYSYQTNVEGDGGLLGQLTELELLDGRRAYVRERHCDRCSFYESSGARQGLKAGDRSRVPGEQVLELCAPADVWQELSSAVARVDRDGRRVRRGRGFGEEWACSWLDRDVELLRLGCATQGLRRAA